MIPSFAAAWFQRPVEAALPLYPTTSSCSVPGGAGESLLESRLADKIVGPTRLVLIARPTHHAAGLRPGVLSVAHDGHAVDEDLADAHR